MTTLHDLEPTLRERAADRCELCGAVDNLRPYAVPPVDEMTSDKAILVCETCDGRLSPDAALDEVHWFCLKDAVWTPVPAVQVTAVRLLKRLGDVAWTQDLLSQLYLDDETQAWVEAGSSTTSSLDDDAPTLDANGARLVDGDAVTLIQDLDVKGAGFTAKRGTLVKGIKLTGDPAHVEGKVNKIDIVLKTKFLKKA
jgi:protein PhnA